MPSSADLFCVALRLLWVELKIVERWNELDLDSIWALVGFFCLTSLLPLLGLGGIWLALRARMKRLSGIHIKRESPFDRRVADGSESSPLLCEKCHRPLGPEMLTCPEQASGKCPYHVEPTSEHGATGRNWGWLLTGLAIALAGGMLSWAWFPVSLCPLALGLFAAAVGVYGLAGSGLKVYHKTTGQLWQRHGFSGFALAQFSATALQPLTPAPGQSVALKYPASISALYQGVDASQILYAALLSLVLQGAIKLEHTTTSRTFLGLSLTMEREFVISPGDRFSAVRGAAELERRIVAAVGAWAERADPLIRFDGRGDSRTRVFTHFLTLDDLLYVVFEGGGYASASRLVLNLVEADAERCGWGSYEGGRRRFELLSAYQDSMCADYALICGAHETLAAAHADVFSALTLAVKRALNALESS